MGAAIMSGLASLYFTTAGQHPEAAFETWRRLMAPLFDVKPFSRVGEHPGGSVIAYLLGDLMVNRTHFTAQHVTRDRKRADSTPDHIQFQLWRTGGYIGTIAQQAIFSTPGSVVLSDRRLTFDTRSSASDTLGFVIPRDVFTGFKVDAAGFRFDPVRNRLLSARITTLYRRLPHVAPAEVPALRAELVAFLRRILDPSRASDVLEGPELDTGILPLAERCIRTGLADPNLSPEGLAASLQVSRATLYRLFAASGGVRHHIHETRLLAIRDALADPLETRTITRVATDHGIVDMPHFSRSFRARFDMTPRSWRAHHLARSVGIGQHAPEPFWQWYNGLGTSGAAQAACTVADAHAQKTALRRVKTFRFETHGQDFRTSAQPQRLPSRYPPPP
jgi:AraC-like DNA-binding protein